MGTLVFSTPENSAKSLFHADRGRSGMTLLRLCKIFFFYIYLNGMKIVLNSSYFTRYALDNHISHAFRVLFSTRDVDVRLVRTKWVVRTRHSVWCCDGTVVW